MILYVLIHRKIEIKLLLLILLLIPFVIYGILISFNFNAAIEEVLRYSFPIIILLFGYAIKNKFILLLNFIIVFTLINDFIQIINYINWYRGIDQWFYYFASNGTRYYNSTSGILRATGILVFFGLFGYINMIAFFLTRRYYFGKRKKLILTVFIISLLLSFSYKTIGAFLIVLFFEFKNKLKFFKVILFALIIALITIPSTLVIMAENASQRMYLYIIEGNSARSESYRVMLSEIANFNLFGKGIGSFGGPSSTKYNSPLYKELNFNWYNTTNITTTDTYFPHLFVEMGIFGGLIYLVLIISPLIKKKFNKGALASLLIIYFTLFFDSLFSFGLNNLAYLSVSLVLVYAIIEHEKSINIR